MVVWWNRVWFGYLECDGELIEEVTQIGEETGRG